VALPVRNQLEQEAQKAMTPERPAYTRSDLDDLVQMDRLQVLAVVGSFCDCGMDDAAFAVTAGTLLDAAAVPGLGAAVAAADGDAVLDAVAAWVQASEPSALEATRATPGASAPQGEGPSGKADAPGSPGGRPGQLAEAGGRQEEELLCAAEAAMAHRFTFYTETHQLPAQLDWDGNPGTAHWGHDLNRFTFLAPLMAAHRLTGEKRYGRKVAELILNWIEANPIERCFRGTAYAYGSYLNNAIHCPVWARAMAELARNGQVSPLELLRLLKSLQEQLAYLEIVTAGHVGNWPTIGCQGVLGTLAELPLLADTQRLARYSIAALADQVEAQVLPDGVQDELTPHYHRVVVNNILSAATSAGRLGCGLEPRTLGTLRGMLRYLQQMTVPDGSAQVAFNDSDPESVPQVEATLRDLGLGEMILPRSGLGPELYPFAGVALLRQVASEGDLYLAFDGGPFGRGHQHEDKLGFWLHAYGRNLLVDPGRHLYDSSDASYMGHLRSTRAHSSILVDGEGQHSRGRPDTWIAQAPEPVAFSVGSSEIRSAAAYDLGYGKANAIAVVHRREIVLVHDSCWVLFDRLEGAGTHRVESRFQFAPGRLSVAGQTAATQFDDANLLLVASGVWEHVHVECGEENPRGGWYSKGYSIIEPAPALSLIQDAELPLIYAVLLLPYRGSETPAAEFTFDGVCAAIRSESIQAQVNTTLASD
jgi:hypothetical protein